MKWEGGRGRKGEEGGGREREREREDWNVTVNPEIGDVGDGEAVEEGVGGGDKVALVGAVAALLGEGRIAEERVAQPHADVRLGVGGQARGADTPQVPALVPAAAATAAAAAAARGIAPAPRHDHVHAAHVETPARRFVQKSRPFTHYPLNCKRNETKNI